jgi:hypothetical protein
MKTALEWYPFAAAAVGNRHSVQKDPRPVRYNHKIFIAIPQR